MIVEKSIKLLNCSLKKKKSEHVSRSPNLIGILYLTWFISQFLWVSYIYLCNHLWIIYESYSSGPSTKPQWKFTWVPCVISFFPLPYTTHHPPSHSTWYMAAGLHVRGDVKAKTFIHRLDEFLLAVLRPVGSRGYHHCKGWEYVYIYIYKNTDVCVYTLEF